MMDENGVSRVVLGAALEVHRALGPGLLESVYQHALAHEIRLRGLDCEKEVPIAAGYKGIRFDCAYRADLLVEGAVMVEIKAVDMLSPAHSAQLLSYLRLSGCRLGILINFNMPLLRQGIKRVVNNL